MFRRYIFRGLFLLTACVFLAACQTFGSTFPERSAHPPASTSQVRQETRIGIHQIGRTDPPYPWQAYYHEIQANIDMTLDNPFLALDEIRKALRYKPGSVYLRLYEAQILAKTGNLQEAVTVTEKVTNDHPNRLKPWVQLGTLLQLAALKETDDSRQKDILRQVVSVYRNHVLDLDPLKDEAYIALSDIYSKLGDPRRSLAILKEGVQNSPHSAYLPFYLGYHYERSGDDPTALSFYRLANSRDPRFEPALDAMGDLYTRMGDLEKARESYESLLAIESVGRIKLEVKLLKTYFLLKKYPEAVRLLKKTISEHPQNNRLPLILSSILVKENRYDEAVRQIVEILKTHPENPRLLSFLGSVYERSLHFTRAIDTYHLMIRRFPNLYEGAYNLGDLYRRLDNPKKAILYLKDAESLSPERWEIPLSISLAYMDQKKFSLALNALQRAERISPNNPILIFNKAILYDQLDHKRYLPKVISFLKETLKLDKSFADALNYLGYTQVLENGDLVGARYMILHALTVDPANGAYRDSLGWLYDRQGHYLKAIREETKALESMPHDPTVLDHQGRIERHLALKIQKDPLSPAQDLLLRSILFPNRQQESSQNLVDILLARSMSHMRESVMIHPLKSKRVLRYLTWYLSKDPRFIPDLRDAVRLWVRLHPPSGPLRYYRVEAGDTLQTIAAKGSVYGSPRYWKILKKANQSIVRNPNDLPWGTVLSIPPFTPSQKTVRKANKGASAAIFPKGASTAETLRSIPPSHMDAIHL